MKPPEKKKEYWDAQRRRKEFLENKGESATIRLRHALTYDSRCIVCDHDELDHIEYAYLRWISPKNIAEEYGLATQDLEWHIKGTRLDKTRGSKSGRREAVLQFIEMGMTELQKKPPRAADTLNALALYAKLKGELVERHENVGPRSITIVGVPEPGGLSAADKPELGPASDVQQAPLLIPGKVLETNESKE